MASPFLIVGSGRCGSTWLYSILREHPQLALTNEARVLDFLYFCVELAGVPSTEIRELITREPVRMRGIVRAENVAAWTPVFTARAKDACQDFYRQAFPDKPFRWWGDKLPDPRAALSARYLWPDARYLVLVRDPRDVLCSWRAHARRGAVARDYPELVGLTAASLAASWNALYRGVGEQLARHAVPPLWLRYEDLRREPQRRIGEVLAFLELTWTPEVERALQQDSTFDAHATAATPDASIGRWRAELPVEEARAIESACGELMQRFGYA